MPGDIATWWMCAMYSSSWPRCWAVLPCLAIAGKVVRVHVLFGLAAIWDVGLNALPSFLPDRTSRIPFRHGLHHPPCARWLAVRSGYVACGPPGARRRMRAMIGAVDLHRRALQLSRLQTSTSIPLLARMTAARERASSGVAALPRPVRLVHIRAELGTGRCCPLPSPSNWRREHGASSRAGVASDRHFDPVAPTHPRRVVAHTPGARARMRRFAAAAAQSPNTCVPPAQPHLHSLPAWWPLSGLDHENAAPPALAHLRGPPAARCLRPRRSAALACSRADVDVGVEVSGREVRGLALRRNRRSLPT